MLSQLGNNNEQLLENNNINKIYDVYLRPTFYFAMVTIFILCVTSTVVGVFLFSNVGNQECINPLFYWLVSVTGINLIYYLMRIIIRHEDGTIKKEYVFSRKILLFALLTILTSIIVIIFGVYFLIKNYSCRENNKLLYDAILFVCSLLFLMEIIIVSVILLCSNSTRTSLTQ